MTIPHDAGDLSRVIFRLFRAIGASEARWELLSLTASDYPAHWCHPVCFNRLGAVQQPVSPPRTFAAARVALPQGQSAAELGPLIPLARERE